MKIKYLGMTVFMLIFAACSSHHHHEEVEEHHDEKVQFTAYSDSFEVFAEADLLVSGKQSKVLAHFTHLPAFTVLERGQITVRLKVNGKEVRQTLNAPVRKGIYSFDVKPETTGVGELVFEVKTDDGLFNVIVPEVVVYATEEEADEAAETAEISRTNTTVFTKEQSWKVDFETRHPLIEPFGQVLKTTAHIQSMQGDELILTAKINGVVMFSNSGMYEGVNVSNQQVVASILGSGFADNNSVVRFSEAKNNYEKEKADFERVKALAKENIVSEKERLQAFNDFENAKVIYQNLKTNFSAKGQKIISSMSGTIKRVFVENGAYVEAGDPIAIVAQNQKLLLSADVQQKYASILAHIESATVRTAYNNTSYSLENLNGRVVSYGQSTNEDNYLIPVKIQIDNVAGFISGGFVELFLKMKTNTSALTISDDALLEEQGRYFVYVQITPELFEKREVKVGASDGLKTEIIKGITSNDRIVTKGAILVKLAHSTGGLDPHSGHVH